MEIFKTQYVASIGMFALGTTCYSKPFPVTLIDLSQLDSEHEAIEFYTPSGYLLDRFYVNMPGTIIPEYEFINDREGPASFKFTMSELPNFQILRFTKVVWTIGGKPQFTGYIESIPLQGDDKLKFSGFGMIKRLEKTLIVNPYANYQIQSISKVDATLTVTLNGVIPNIDITGLKVVVEGCEESKNDSKSNSYFTIDSYGGVDGNWHIVYNNASGLEQTISLGTVDILPPEWSNINLRSTVIDYCIRHLTSNPARYNASLIEETTGYTTGGAVNFHNMEFSKFLKEMRESLPERFRIGVNEEGFFFLKNESTGIIDKFFEEFDFYDPDLKEDLSKVVNNVSIMREGDGKKWSVAALASDSTSIALYGELVKKVNIPYAIQDGTAQNVADVYLENNKDPKYNIMIKNRPFEIKQFGYYGIVTKAKDYIVTLNHLDNVDDWITEGATTVSIVNDDYISGSGAHELVFTGNVRHVYSTSEAVNVLGIKQIGFYISSNIVGLKVTFGVGKNDWTDKQFRTTINNTGFYIPVFFDLNDFDEIGSIGFYFEPTYPTRQYSVKLDNVFMIQNTNIHYEMPLKKQSWKIKDGVKNVDFEYGMLETNKLAEFVSSTSAGIQNNTLMVRGNG